MANEENLVKGDEAHKFTPEEHSKGGKRSGEVRAARRDLRKALEALLDKEFEGKDGVTLSGAEAIALKQMEKALKGDTKAFEVVRDTAGQKPIEKVMLAEVEQSVIEEVEKAVLDESSTSD